jgi:hypothetical protein
MTVITKLIAGGAAVAALASAAPAAAQYNPGYGYPYGGGPVGGGYGANSQVLVNQCAAAVQQRLNRNSGYGSPYGYGGGARVLGISRIEPRGDGGLRIRGVATSYGGRPNLTFSCKTDYRGFIRDVDIDPAYRNYGYGSQPYNPYDYSQYGYRRY